MGFYGLIASAFVVSLIFTGVSSYHKGRESREPEIVELHEAITAAKQAAIDAENRARVVVEREVVKYRDRVKTIVQKEPGEIQLVEVIRAEANPPLSPSFRLLHDSAASGDDPIGGSSGVDGAPVPVEDVAETIRQNYQACRNDQAKLAGLQEIIRSQ